MRNCLCRLAPGGALLLVAAAMAGLATADGLRADEHAGPAAAPALRTNEAFIKGLQVRQPLEIADPISVFRFVFARLPARVRVYPTENYYYFSFLHRGIEYAGNLRLAARDRDQGILHFAYFAAARAWAPDSRMHYRKLSAPDDVRVRKTGRLEYEVSFEGRAVVFALNDLSGVAPPEGLLREGEAYLGPVFDESGIEFFLVFNRNLKIFHYVLNETGTVPDRMEPSAVSDRILIGRRTGFAFFQERDRDRKILIGVQAANVALNTYYDGPFDQLPDNFNEDDTLRAAIEASDPSVAGRLDRYGYIAGTGQRYLIGPYLHYSEPRELLPLARCAESETAASERYLLCLAVRSGG